MCALIPFLDTTSILKLRVSNLANLWTGRELFAIVFYLFIEFRQRLL